MTTPFVVKSAKIYLDGYDLSSRSSDVSGTYEFPEVDVTCYGDEVKHGIPGVPSIGLDLTGLAVADGTGDSEDVIEAKLAAANVVATFGYTGADGTPGFLTKLMPLTESLGGPMGEAFGFRVSAVAQGYKLVRGYFLVPRLSRTATAAGTVKQIAAVTATEKVYAALHVFAVSGTDPTLDVIVQSDDASGFASGVTRISMTQAEAIGSEIKSADGPITDDYWRVSWTIGGTNTPTFDFAVLVGIA